MKKVKDHYYKKAKKEKYPSRSVYKLEEIQQKYRILKPGDRVLDLGYRPGSWTMFAARTIGAKGLVVGIDLHRGKNPYVTGAAEIRLHHADIFSEDALNTIKKECPSFNVVLSDLAPKTTGHKLADHLQSVELSKRALELAESLLSNGGTFYCKVFQGEDFPLFVNEIRRCFKTTKVVKPKSSRSESREVFVLGREFKRRIKCPDTLNGIR